MFSSTRIVLRVVTAMVIITLASTTVLFARIALDKEWEARVARHGVESMTEHMVFEVHDQMLPLGRLDVLRKLNERTLAVINLPLPERNDWEDLYGWVRALTNLGDVHQAQGDLAGARAYYRRAQAVGERFDTFEPSVALWESGQTLLRLKVGRVLQAQGDLAGALAEFRQIPTIREQDIGEEPFDQDHLATSQEQVGEVLQAQGDLAGALKNHRAALAIRETLARQAPGNLSSLQNLMIANRRLGEVLQAQGDLAGALKSYRQALAITTSLTNYDPFNTLWQHDLSLSHLRVGGLRQARGDHVGALGEFQHAVAIGERLIAHDPGNAQWRHTLVAARRQLGQAMIRKGDRVEGRRQMELADEGPPCKPNLDSRDESLLAEKPAKATPWQIRLEVLIDRELDAYAHKHWKPRKDSVIRDWIQKVFM
jgi:tetratricopeptide (TPR) repeat protein